MLHKNPKQKTKTLHQNQTKITKSAKINACDWIKNEEQGFDQTIGDVGDGDAQERGGDARRAMGGRRRAAIDDGRRKEWDGWEMGTSRGLRRKWGRKGPKRKPEGGIGEIFKKSLINSKLKKKLNIRFGSVQTETPDFQTEPNRKLIGFKANQTNFFSVSTVC